MGIHLSESVASTDQCGVVCLTVILSFYQSEYLFGFTYFEC